MTDNTLLQLLSAIQKSDDGHFLRFLAETPPPPQCDLF